MASGVSAGATSLSHDTRTALVNAMKLSASLGVTWTIGLLVRFWLPRHLGPEQFGDFADGRLRKHHSDPLALTQLLLVHRILSARKSMLLRVDLSTHEALAHHHAPGVAHDHEHP